MNRMTERIREYIRQHQKDRTFRRGVTLLACLIVFTVTYLLIYPALALEKEAACGIEAHEHTEECYTRVLACDLEESDGHTHSEECYETEQILVCEQEEHEHDENCYDEEGNLICQLDEHAHDEDCFKSEKTLVCQLEEADPHWHDTSCYKEVLTCQKEVHVHTDDCYKKDTLRKAAAADEGEADSGVDEEAKAEAEEVSTASAEEQTEGLKKGSADSEASGSENPEEDGSTEENRSDASSDGKKSSGRRASKKAGKSLLKTGTDTAKTGTEKEDSSQAGTEKETQIREKALPEITFSRMLTDTTGLWAKNEKGKWQRLDEDSELAEDADVLVRIAYEIPEGSLDSENASFSYRLPRKLKISKEMARMVNQDENHLNQIIEGDRLPGKKADDREYLAGRYELERSRRGRGTLKITLDSYTVSENASRAVSGWLVFYVKATDLPVRFSGKGTLTFAEKTLIGEEIKTHYAVTRAASAEEVSSEEDTKAEENNNDNGETLKVTEGETEDPRAAETVESTEISAAEEESTETETEPESETEKEAESEEEEESSGPAQNFEQKTDDVLVHVYAQEGAFPAGTTMKVSPADDEDTIAAIKDSVKEAADADKGSSKPVIKNIYAVDISFYNEDGEEIEPSQPVCVIIEPRAAETKEEKKDTKTGAADQAVSGSLVVHVNDAGETSIVKQAPAGQVPADLTETAEMAEGIEKASENAAVFSADGFSVYAVVYTVDFHWEVDGKTYEFSIEGGAGLSLSELLTSLDVVTDDKDTDENEIQQFMDEVEDVSFSNTDLVWVGRVKYDNTIADIKEYYSLACDYSAELTQDEIDALNNKEVKAGEWVLISLKPFLSEETLTVTMKNGDQFVVRVTDYQISTNVLTADGKNYKITVTYDDEAEIPAGTKLAVEEIEPGTDEYLQHLGEAWAEVNKEYLEQEEKKQTNKAGLDEYEDIRPVNLDDARFFSISLIDKGEEIEPKASVRVDIEYVDGFVTDAEEKDQVIGVAHYKREETELITDVETERNEAGEIVEFVYEQDSFSDIGTYVGQETYDNMPYKINSAIAMPMLRALSNTTKNGNQLKDIEAHKKLTNNNDGTYTMSLTVKGDSVANEEYNKANILFVMDRSSSMVKNNATYEEYNGTYQYGTTYYGSNDGKTFFTLYYRDRNYYNGGLRYNGTIYTGVTRLAAEQAAMRVLVDNLLSKNEPTTAGKEDLIEISIISFADRRNTGVTEYTDWATVSNDDLMTAIDDNTTDSGTNWEDALLYAQQQADIKKKLQPDEDVYVIFLTDGEPTAVAGESGDAWHYNDREGGFEYALTEKGGPYNSHGRTQDGLNSLDRAKALVDSPNNYKFYGIFTFNPGEDQTKFLRRLMNFAYTGVDKAYENDSTKEDTDIVKKYFTNADTPEALTAAFERIFADVTSTLGHGDVVITDGLTAADAMTTTIHADRADGFRYSVTNDETKEELYYVTATGTDSNPSVTFYIDGNPYQAGDSKEGVDGKPYYSVNVSGAEYKMALADLSGRELKWDLSAIGPLLPDCTYKMDIIVWPNQDAYDYVAGLNNHLPGYSWNSSVESNPDNYHEVTVDDVTYGYYTGGVSGHSSIVKYKDSGVFSVLTNTHQELNYSIVNTKTNQVTGETTTTSDPQKPIPLEPQKPMDLVNTHSSIAKIWNVGRDPSILAQLLYGNDERYSVTFDILKDDNPETTADDADNKYTSVVLGWDPKANDGAGAYIWDTDSVINNVPYNTKEGSVETGDVGTRWVGDFSIATGLMLSSDRMDEIRLDKSNYRSVDYKGTTYYILEDGHDYTIKELNPRYEFDFKSPIYHPMLVDGVLTSVNVTKDAQGKINGITKMTEISVDETGVSALEIENTLRGYLHLNKVVVDHNEDPLTSDHTKFEYTITLNDSKGRFTGEDIPWYAINGLFYHDENSNYYQAAPTTTGHLSLTSEFDLDEDGENDVYDATCEGEYNPDSTEPTTVTFTDKAGEEHTIQLSGNQMKVTSGNTSVASAVIKISQAEVLTIANIPENTKYTIEESVSNGYELIDINWEIKDGETVEQLTDNTLVPTIASPAINGTIISNRDNHVTYTNKRLITDMTIQKLDGSGNALPGAVFQLVSVDGYEETPVSDVGGLGQISRVINGKSKTYEGAFETTNEVQQLTGLFDGTYRLYEVCIPDGYVSTFRYIQFSIENQVVKDVEAFPAESEVVNFTEASQNSLALIEINNTPGAALPNTGGPGTTLFYLFGFMLTGLAGAGLLMKSRRKSAA